MSRLPVAGGASSVMVAEAATASTVGELAGLLRRLHRRDGRQRGDSPLTYRELATRIGWSHGVIGDYFAGKVLPPTDRFDVLVEVLGATDAERGVLATARDRVEERRRRGRSAVAVDVVPRQLPTGTATFVGRDDALARLDALLTHRESRSGAALVVVSGTAGVGKTSLAVSWAHRVARHFPDGQLYVDLRGFHPTGFAMPAAEAVRRFLDGLGMPPERIPVDVEAQAALLRSLLTGRRVLLVLDNAATVAQVRPLIPGASGCLVLVTSRDRLPGLIAVEGADPISLDLLSPAEAEEFLAGRLGPARVAREPEAVRRLIAACARLPLALAIVSARAAAHPTFALAALADELEQARSALDVLYAGDPSTDMRAVLSWSYRLLSAEAARLFRQLGSHPGPDISASAAAGTAGLPVARTSAILAELSRAHLIIEHHPGRYAFHDLLRDYAAEMAESQESPDDRRATARRLLDHYLHTAHAAGRLVSPDKDPIPLVPLAPGVTVGEFTGIEAALTWLTIERPGLMAAARLAESLRFDAHVWQLAWTMSDFLARCGHGADQTAVQIAALEAARRLGDRSAQARAHRGVARALAHTGRTAEAEVHLQQALELFGGLGDQINHSHVHQQFAIVLEYQGRLADALRQSELALELRRAVGHEWGAAESLNSVGWYQARLGDYAKALVNCREALAVQQRMGYRTAEPDTLDSIGYAYRELGDYQRAVACYEQALALYREFGNVYHVADTMTSLGDTWAAADEPEAARRTWRGALTIFESIGHPDAENVRAKLRPPA